MRHLHSTIGAALLVFACGAPPCNDVNAATDDVMLDGLSALSQLDPQNYRDIGLMLTTDTLPNSSKRTAVANLSCAATVYVMIERGRGQASVMIDDFKSIPACMAAGGREPGARTTSAPTSRSIARSSNPNFALVALSSCMVSAARSASTSSWPSAWRKTSPVAGT